MNDLLAKDRFLISAVLALGLLATAFLLWVAHREIERRDQVQFTQEVIRIRDSLAAQIGTATESLSNIGALLTISPSDVDGDGFRMIAESTLKQQPAVKVLFFSRWVPAFRKQEFEEQNWRSSGVADFKIHAGAKPLPAAEFYTPIVFLEPFTPATIVHLGFDLWSDDVFRPALREAMETGEAVVSPISLFQTKSGMEILKAVYSGKISLESVAQRKNSIIGILSVILDSDNLLKNFADSHQFNISLKTPGGLVLASQQGPPRGFRQFFEGRLVENQQFKVSNLNFDFTLEKSIPFSVDRAIIYLIIFLMGVSLSTLVAMRLAQFLRGQKEIQERQAEIERQVQAKTEALQKSEVLLRQVINANSNVIFAQKEDQKILFANQTFFQLFQTTPQKIYGRAIGFGLPGQKGLYSVPYEEQIALPDGTLKWFETIRSTIDLEDHGVGTLVVAVDITQRKADEAVIAEQRAKMVSAAKLLALGEMAGGIAHEINTPLTTIQLHSEQIWEILKEAHPNLSAIGRHALSISKTSDRIAKIVHGLRTFSRDGSKDERNVFSLRQTILSTLELCGEKFQHWGVRLDIAVSETTRVYGREVQISQVLLNLLNNAFDAVQGKPNPWISVSTVESASMVQIIVEDNGEGIPGEIREKMFQPFFTTKDIGKGTGLGLSISKGIVESHSGRLICDDRSFNTKFIVELPRVQFERPAEV